MVLVTCSAAYGGLVDDHAHRIVQPFLDAWQEFLGGNLTLLDLSGKAGQAAAALDNASAPLPKLFAAAESDLEYAYFATEAAHHVAEAQRIVAPLLAAVGG